MVSTDLHMNKQQIEELMKRVKDTLSQMFVLVYGSYVLP